MKLHRRWIFAIGAVVAALAIRAMFYRGRGPASLDQSRFLRAVVEPITIVDGMSFSDGGSQGLSFKDACGTERVLWLEDSRNWEKDHTILEGHNNISLNSFFPGGGTSADLGGRGAGGIRVA